MSRIGDLLLDSLQTRKDEIQEMIDNHDCHLTPEDSCPCLEWREELKSL